MKEEIIDLLNTGHTYSEIAAILGCAKSTISYHAKCSGKRKMECPRIDWDAVSAFQIAGHSASDCMREFGFSASAWAGAVRRGLVSQRSYPPIDPLSKHSRRRNSMGIKIAFIATGVEIKCAICGYDTWMGKPIPLQLDHINGDGLDNRVENLRLLCATCHSQTETYGGKNASFYKEKYALVYPIASNDLKG